MDAGGTRKIEWAAEGNRASGTVGSWSEWSIASTELGEFSDTDWNSRSVVEIAAVKEIRGLVLSRYHRRSVVAEDEVPSG